MAGMCSVKLNEISFTVHKISSPRVQLRSNDFLIHSFVVLPLLQVLISKKKNCIPTGIAR